MTLTKTMTFQVLRSAVGKSKEVPFVTLNEASAAYRAFIEENGFGGRDAGICVIKSEGKVVAHVSYNGKVWAGSPVNWTGATELLFNPYQS